MTDADAATACIHRMTAAFDAHDLDAVLATYEPGALVVAEPGKPQSGTPALRAMFQGFLALDPRFQFSGEEIFVAGDLALHFNTWTMTGRMPDGSPVTQGGLSAAVLRRQPSGEWLMVVDDPFADALLHR